MFFSGGGSNAITKSTYCARYKIYDIRYTDVVCGGSIHPLSSPTCGSVVCPSLHFVLANSSKTWVNHGRTREEQGRKSLLVSQSGTNQKADKRVNFKLEALMKGPGGGGTRQD